MFVLGVIAAVLSLICISAFRAFAANYAATIYRDFSACVPAPTVEDIRARAQEIYERDGKPNGKAEDHWLRAEKQLRG